MKSKSEPSKLKLSLLELVREQSDKYGYKLAWRLYKAFYTDEATLDILKRARTIQGALRLVAHELHRAEKIYNAGYEAGRNDNAK